MTKNFGTVSWIAFILVVIGGLNWGLVGLFNFNLVSAIFGMGVVARIIYILVGVSAVWAIYDGFRCMKACGGSSSSPHQ